jgi:hypothetical protein
MFLWLGTLILKPARLATSLPVLHGAVVGFYFCNNYADFRRKSKLKKNRKFSGRWMNLTMAVFLGRRKKGTRKIGENQVRRVPVEEDLVHVLETKRAEENQDQETEKVQKGFSFHFDAVWHQIDRSHSRSKSPEPVKKKDKKSLWDQAPVGFETGQIVTPQLIVPTTSLNPHQTRQARR